MAMDITRRFELRSKIIKIKEGTTKKFDLNEELVHRPKKPKLQLACVDEESESNEPSETNENVAVNHSTIESGVQVSSMDNCVIIPHDGETPSTSAAAGFMPSNVVIGNDVNENRFNDSISRPQTVEITSTPVVVETMPSNSIGESDSVPNIEMESLNSVCESDGSMSIQSQLVNEVLEQSIRDDDTANASTKSASSLGADDENSSVELVVDQGNGLIADEADDANSDQQGLSDQVTENQLTGVASASNGKYFII